jgi:L-ascorbate metabolism protein UlaG (beta-lactamase superfamily)
MAVKISRVLHAGYIFEYQGCKILFDPLFENPFSVNCYAYPAVRFDQERIRKEKFDAIFISHYHDDHCSLESLNLLDRATPIYMFCVFEEMFSILRELGFQNVHALELNQAVSVGPFQIIPRQALDADVDSLLQIKVDGLNILNVVDSWIDYDTLDLLKAEKPWDLVLWPFQTMRELAVISPSQAEPASTELPAEWIEQIQTLNPKVIVPSSCQFIHEEFSWYRRLFFPISYRQFEKEISEKCSGMQVQRMNPGCSFSLDKQAMHAVSALPWVIPIGSQDVDYDFDEKAQVPTMSDFVKKLPSLTQDNLRQVYEYCEHELSQRYAQLEIMEDSYFSVKPRLWLLKVYDHQGIAKDFYFRVAQNSVALAEASEESIDWLTEIAAVKIFGALENGESLSSLYVRIEPHTSEADPMEDPLLRCLYEGFFGSYQKAQLKRLASKHA